METFREKEPPDLFNREGDVSSILWVSVEAAEGRMDHNNGWNGANGNHVFDSIPLILPQPIPRARPPQLRCTNLL
jgi:hypothetical protein